MRTWRVLFSALLLVLGSSPARAQDSGKVVGSDVAMFRGNAARTGVMPGPGPDPEQGLGVRWRFDAEAEFDSSPAVADVKLPQARIPRGPGPRWI